ncbi:MAG: HAD family hydrolase [Methanobacteriaceae archaeon]|nr:HAD family hydrolase [Methanobacteriaceae archaeon]MDP2836488.1 HAD family hydrolase [Methanobacteriaceae archaeon]MDP3035520.1 HAD family hydrolase [Methanobacteriaceae archaeon]MDP3484559.1 HAD family hydrolase [Methanobacteriaceae archaeon]MDP3622849.1 HAD family hydrolase [Methanobacteriaceae archaeon]
MNPLVLFDIDKTLIDRSECHHQAFIHAFKKIYRVDTSVEVINYHGKTDPQIMHEVLLAEGLTENDICPYKNDFLDSMSEYFVANVKYDKIKVMDGAVTLLKELENRKVLLGLLTGNIEIIAYFKLNHVDLGHYFKLGGFGSDSYYRSNLVLKAIQRAENDFRFVRNKNNVFVVGDTPLDVAAGLKAGILTIGVASGEYCKEELINSGANFVLDDLSSTDEFLKIVL